MAKKIQQWASAPEMLIDLAKNYKAVMHTDKGDITLDLFEKLVPRTVNNFVFLAREGYYDGTIFHRVIMNFMAQGGDPTGTGAGGPGSTTRYYVAISSNEQLPTALNATFAASSLNPRIRLEPVRGDEIRYWRDAAGVHHVPKRALADVVIN